MTRVRYNKYEVSTRRTAAATLLDPNASSTAKYHASLLLDRTDEAARTRASAAKATEPETPLAPPVSQHRTPQPNPKAERFLKEIDEYLRKQEREAEATHVGILDLEASATDLAACDSHATEHEFQSNGESE